MLAVFSSMKLSTSTFLKSISLRKFFVPSVLNFHHLLVLWLGLSLILPWLYGYATSPSINAWPWLFSAACAIILWLFHSRLSGDLIAIGWVIAASLSAGIGLMQYFGLESVLSPWISSAPVGEAFANLRQRNQFATLTSIGLVALLAWLALLDKRRCLSELPRVPWWASALAVLLAVGNAASNSRTGLLQWVLIGLFAAWWFWLQRRYLVVFIFQAWLSYGIATLTLPWLLELVTGIHSDGMFGRLSTNAGCSSRMVLWSNVLTLIGQKPWLGWGWGELDYAHFITLYPGVRFCEILDNAHNLPLHLAVEFGLPTALSICSLLAWLIWRTRPWHETDPVRQMAWGVLAVIALHSMLEYPLWYGPFQIAVGLCFWLLWVRKEDGVSVLSAISYLRIILAITMGIGLAVVSESYYQLSQVYLPLEKRSVAYREDTLNKVMGNRLFRQQVHFAELSLTNLTPDNAAEMYVMAQRLLHYSPESRVIERVIESAVMLGRQDEARAYLIRYQAAFPDTYARWIKEKNVTQ
jgi:hypothetical protein